MMKSAMLLGILASLGQPEALRPPQGQPSLLGTWVLDLSKSDIPADARPQSVTMSYSDAGGDKWTTTMAIVGRDGGKINATGTYPLDGTIAPSTGYPNVDSVAVKVPSPNVMVAAFYKERVPRSTRTYIVSPDGQSMTENIVWLNPNGAPEIGINRFNRVR